MLQLDNIQRFVFETADIRGELVHLGETTEKILTPHHYPEPIKHILTEVTLCTILMAATIKFKGQMTVQFQGDDALKLLLVKCNHLFELRALAQYDENADKNDWINALTKGNLVVTIEMDEKVKPYQSIVPVKESVAKSLAHYFTQSEQLASSFWLAIENNHGAGLLLQQLPKQVDTDETRESNWQEALTLANTLTPEELLQLDNETLLHRLYHEHQLRLFPAEAVSFKCTCNRARMLEMVRTMGKEDAYLLLKTHRMIEVKCEFCQQSFSFEKSDINFLFESQ